MFGVRYAHGATRTLAAAALLTGCGAVHPTIDELQVVPGANAHYRSSIAYAVNQIADENTVWNQSSAQLIQFRCSQADEQQTINWFQQHLAQRAGPLAPTLSTGK